MGKAYPVEPRRVPPVETKYRRIVTDIPAPESLPVLEKLRAYEPRSMSGQPPIVWDRAVGVNVYDRYGNMWLDFSSGVLVTNAGHGRKEVVEALGRQIAQPLLHHYCFPAEPRALLVEKIAELSPDPLKKVFLLTTGSEAVECALKLARTWGGPKKKTVVVSFEGGFHGRTLGSQMAGGTPALKAWIPYPDPGMVQVPFPGDPRCKDRSFDAFTSALAALKVRPADVCAVISETYQGAHAALMPVPYAQALRRWCDENGALLVFDEVQAGFGRTGTRFGFEHYKVLPDLFVLGKGVSSSLPLSAVVGRPDIMDLYEPGTMTSTHTGNPLCCAAALAGIALIEKENLAGRAAGMQRVFAEELGAIKADFPQVGFLCGVGMVWALHFVKKGTETPDPDFAFDVVGRCVEKGLMLFAPVGYCGATIKVNPPLTITEDAVVEGCGVLREAIGECAGR